MCEYSFCTFLQGAFLKQCFEGSGVKQAPPKEVLTRDCISFLNFLAVTEVIASLKSVHLLDGGTKLHRNENVFIRLMHEQYKYIGNSCIQVIIVEQ